MALSEHTRRLVEQYFARYCARICPPQFERQVRLSFWIDGNDVWLNELRPLFRSYGMVATREVALARLRFDAATSTWRLHHCDERRRLRPYAPLPRSREFVRLLREIDRDPHGVFWARVNGASLRWCSSRGRCPACDERYSRIVGCHAGGGHVSVSETVPLRVARETSKRLGR